MADTPNNSNAAGGKEERIEIKRLGFHLELLISADGLTCAANYTPSGSGIPMTNDELQKFLAQSKIREGVIDGAIAMLLDSAANGRPVANCIIAQGTPMVPGVDGILQLAVSDSLETEKPPVEEGELSDSGQIDLKRVQSFLNVSTGQLVATVVPPGPGTPGINVRGNRIPAQPGIPLDLVLVKNVRLGDDGVSLYAEADGRFCSNGKELSVEDIYLIKGDVDFKVGNIIFNGYLEIKGDVLDGFTVKATKGIKIDGNVGVSTISSEADITFCGMNGQGKGTVTCGGTLQANFIDDAVVDAEGDVLVETEIRNSHINSNGCIKVNKGVVAGGECIALGGIESNIIGTVTSQRTRLIVGVCYRDLLELNRLFNELKELVASFSANSKTADPKAFAAARAAITEKIQEVRGCQYPECNGKINVKKRLHDGVSLTIGQLSEDLRDGRDGPFSVIENTVDGGFRYIGLTDLSVKAKDIEEAFVQQLELQKGSEV